MFWMIGVMAAYHIIVFYLFVVFSCKRADERLHDNAAVSKPEWIVLELIGDMVYHLGSEIHLNVVKLERKSGYLLLNRCRFLHSGSSRI